MPDQPETHLPATSDTAALPAPPPAVSRRRRLGARTLILLATLLATLSIFATWAREQLLNTDQWVKTSTELLENRVVSDAVANFLVDELYANVDVSGQIGDRLPPELQPLAPAAAAAVRQGLDQVSRRALQNPRTQSLWADANRVAHERLVAVVLEQDTGAVTARDGVVTLDLRSILVEIGQRLGLPQAALSRIPPSAASIELVRSDELKSAQNAAQLLRSGSYVLTALALLLLAAAVALARGDRRATLLLSGVGLIAAGVIVLVTRGIAGNAVVDALSATASVRPAATATWDIATSLLVTLGAQAVIVGAAAVIAAWLAGPSRPATGLRRLSAPAVERRPEFVGIGVVVALLALIAWAPIPALRRPLFIVFLLVAVGIGVVALRRQILREFPDAAGPGPGLSGLLQRGTAATTGARRAIGSAVTRVNSVSERSAGHDPTPLPASDEHEQRLAQLERLATLRDAGVLDADEFAAEKERVLRA